VSLLSLLFQSGILFKDHVILAMGVTGVINLVSFRQIDRLSFKKGMGA
jgi:hypothetical protein